jgi:high-affinity nickel permease
MLGTLGLGLLLGMQHALEADHIAAATSIAARRTGQRIVGTLLAQAALTIPDRDRSQLSEPA